MNLREKLKSSLFPRNVTTKLFRRKVDVILRVFYEEKLFPRKYDVNFAWYLRGNSLRVFSEEIFESTNFIGVARFFCPPN